MTTSEKGLIEDVRIAMNTLAKVLIDNPEVRDSISKEEREKIVQGMMAILMLDLKNSM